MLSTGLTAQLEGAVRPLIATLPASARARLDLAHLRNGATGRDAGVAAEVRAALEATAMSRADPRDARALTPAASPAATLPPDIAERIALTVRRAFAAAITRIYWGAASIALGCALIVALGLPELPLRTSNRPEAFEEIGG